MTITDVDIRNRTEQEDVIRTTVSEESRGKSRYRWEGTERRMYSETTFSRLLGPHCVHTWAGYDRHWQNVNVSLTTVEEHTPEGELSLVNKRVGVMEDLYGIRVINHHPL